MSFTKKLVVIVLIIAMLVSILVVGNRNNLLKEEEKEQSFYQVETVYLWYTEEVLTDYLTNAAVEFHEKNPGIRVIPTLMNSGEYLEEINKASLKNENFPDLYMLTNDSLEKAYLAGLASKVRDPKNIMNEEHFGKGALNAVSYHDEYVAYPIAFETSVLLYNKTYLKNWVEKVNSEDYEAVGEGLSYEDLEFEEGDEQIEHIEDIAKEEAHKKQITIDDYIPDSFDKIKAFADVYEAPDRVSSILKWDVSDIFYNYMFVGNYMIVGGDAGDDTSNIDIDNDATIACMQVYQQLNQTFSIDAKTSDYADVLSDFLDGKTVYTLVTSDAIAKVNAYIAEKEEQKKIAAMADALDEETTGETAEESKEESSEDAQSTEIEEFEFGYACVPDVSEAFRSRSLSVTDSLVINGYSEKKDSANLFATFLATDYAGKLYEKSGKLSASKDAGYEDEAFVTFMQEYEESIPLPKLVEASNLWVQLEIAFTDIWSGEDPVQRFKEFASQIKSQVVTE